MFRGRYSLIYVASLLLHAGGAFAVASIHEREVHEATRIRMSEAKPKKAKPPKNEPPSPPPIVKAPKPAPRPAPKPAAPAPEAAPAPVAAAAPAASAAPVADFGLSMTGGVGGGGVAVPVGAANTAAPRVTKTAAPKALTKPAPSNEDSCLEALVKPKPISVPQPVYSDKAREAGIAGKVRVELTVDESGNVVETKVIESLGYGLDEAALEAARNARFEPAMRCGKATRTTFVIGIRFSL